MTKEEFLDKKNIEIIKNVEQALNLKSEIDVLTSYFLKKQKENPILSCSLVRRKVVGIKTNYHVHQVLVDLVEMIDKGELILNSEKTES